MESIAGRIKQLRLAAGETQRQLGQVAGVRASAINQLEAGKSKSLQATHVVTIARHYGVDVTWLVTGSGSRDTHTTATPFEHQLLALFRRLSLDGQHAALAHLNWLLAQENPGSATAANPFPNANKSPHKAR